MGLLNDSLHVNGTLSAGSFNPPAGSITDAAIIGNAGIDDGKTKHRYHFKLSQTGTVVTATEYLKILAAAGSVLTFEAAITEAIPTGADRTITIDLQKSTGGGAFATILSASIVFNNASVLRTISTATISSPTLADGDMLRVTVAVAGAAGAQGQGLLVSAVIRENAQ